MAITMEDSMRERRRLIEAVWRRVNGFDETRSLACSEQEWKFYDALLDELYGPHWIPSIVSTSGK